MPLNFQPQQPVEWQNVYSLKQVDQAMMSEMWCAQEKLDGEKVFISCKSGNLLGFYRSGRRAELSAKTIALMPVNGDFFIEGEQGNATTGDTGYQAFDVISVRGQNMKHLPYVDRLAALHELGVPVVETAYTEPEKRVLHVGVYARGGEGIVLKRLDIAYEEGRTCAQFKLKNWKSETFRVVSADDRGMDLAWLIDGSPAGRCPGWVCPGDLVEVRFREVTSAGRLRHPVLLRRRCDLE